jgi:hypothetical protein
MEVSVIDNLMYGGREIYVLEINGKRTTVYRSTGTGGRTAKGQLVPFLYLNEGRGIDAVRYSPGYIFKAFYYNGGEKEHAKRLELYNIDDVLESIEKCLETYEPCNKDLYDLVFKEFEGKTITDRQEVYDAIFEMCKGINKRLEDSLKETEPFDWYIKE